MESDFENFFLGKKSVNCVGEILYIMRRCRFNIGDKVVCIRQDDVDIFYIDFSTTRFKVYEVVEIPSKMYDNVGIVNDKGSHIIPTWDDYVTLKELRKLKLDKINGK